MKTLKVCTILGVVACALLASAWVLNLVPEAEAVESLKKILAVLLIFTVSSAAIFLVVGKSKGTENVSK